MPHLSVTLIDVGWGDSIFVESTDDAGQRRFALVDCNDYETERSSLIYVKRYLHRAGIDFESNRPNFSWALLTHGHADHSRGMKRMLSTFGTRQFWYPKSVASPAYGATLKYASSSNLVLHHQAVDSSKILDPATTDFGDVALTVLWPDYDQVDPNENNNSVVMAVTLGDVTLVLTGDAEAENWPKIVPRLPPGLKVFQVPHHGGLNGTFDPQGNTPWLDAVDPATRTALSSHIRPHGHPHPDVVTELEDRQFEIYRTDIDSHLTFATDGTDVTVQYSHV
jgi:competence protein ComEC